MVLGRAVMRALPREDGASSPPGEEFAIAILRTISAGWMAATSEIPTFYLFDRFIPGVSAGSNRRLLELASERVELGSQISHFVTQLLD